ncbi:MAG: hypothetical protein BGO77_00820 [Caedibacter sp. 37-49]|nr:MAG: hypothetical protein BGO77_00820 [Caedibacter sp. 37-49]
MKFFKKLLLSTTAIFATIGSINSVDALGAMKSLHVTNSLAPQSTELASRQNSQLAIQSEIKNFYHSEDAMFLMPHLKEIISFQGQDEKTFEAKQKERSQLLDYILQYKKIRNNQQEPAKLLQEIPNHTQQLREEIAALKEEIKQLRQHALIAHQEQHIRVKPEEGENELLNNEIVIERNEFEGMTAQIKSLINQVTQLQESNQQLQESHLNLNSSISLLKTSYEEGRNQLPMISSAALPIQSSSSTTPTGDDKETFDANSSKTETTSPTVTETPTPSEDTIDTSKASAEESIEWNKENFIQMTLGKRPDDLTSLTTDEVNLWRTFTLLSYKNPKQSTDLNALLAESEDKAKMKLWSTWGGAYTTEELEEKFKANGFMTRAFQIKKAISFNEDIINDNSEAIFTYFTSNKPEITPETESDLVKAYYFRGLFRTLTNYSGERTLPSRTYFNIDLTNGIKGSHFKYLPDQTKANSYETSIIEAEELFENTPWHQLFINQVQQATLNTLNQKMFDLKKEYRTNLMVIKDEKDESTLQSLMINSKTQYEIAVDVLEEMHKGVLKANSLHEIDDALELRS